MGKHRKKQSYRRIVVAVIAVGTVGAPSVALACGDWRDGGGSPFPGDGNQAPVSAPWRVPTAASTPATAAPQPWTAPQKPRTAPQKPRAAAPWHTGRTTAPQPGPAPSAGTPSGTPAAPAAPSTSAAPTPPSTPAPTATASGTTARVVELVNSERGKAGCSPLTVNATLTKAAQAHSEDMAAHRNMSHTGSDGSSPGDRITRAGYTWRTYGENVAYGYSTPEQVMAGWMSSPGHKANILNCSFKEIGVGLAQPGSYWTQNFGASR
ncbi:CAP domain-containing protein [Streptomyces kebangsaanensis]|uniref:CAP domain-containing protein n=1 Tax=Streptomyces kebangsaanensis TaxID=864058 RepID=A0ABW6KT78_9ACTN